MKIFQISALVVPAVFAFFFVVCFARSVEEGIKKNASENRLIKGWVGRYQIIIRDSGAAG